MAIIGVVIIDIILSFASAALIIDFGLGSDSNHFLPEYVKDHEDELSEVETYTVLLLLPNVIVLLMKTFYGIRWMYLDYKRSAYQTYYMTSQSFYTSFTIQEIMIIIFSWKVFNKVIRYGQITAVISCFIVHFFMRMNMKFLDK